MSNNMGVFQWIRDSVRRSVLLGFSDAVEQLGVPSGEAGQVSPQLLAVLRQVETTATASTVTAQPMVAAEPVVTSKPERKRLGRSLEQLRDPGSKGAEGKAA